MFVANITRVSECNLQQACEFLIWGWRPMLENEERYDIKNNRQTTRPEYPLNTDEYFVRARVICQALMQNYISLYNPRDFTRKIQFIELPHKLQSLIIDLYENESKVLIDLENTLRYYHYVFYFQNLKTLKNYRTLNIDDNCSVYIVGNCVFYERPDGELLCIRVLKNASTDLILKYIMLEAPDTMVDIHTINQYYKMKNQNTPEPQYVPADENSLRNVIRTFINNTSNYSPAITDRDKARLKKFFIYDNGRFKFVSEPQLDDADRLFELP